MRSKDTIFILYNFSQYRLYLWDNRRFVVVIDYEVCFCFQFSTRHLCSHTLLHLIRRCLGAMTAIVLSKCRSKPFSNITADSNNTIAAGCPQAQQRKSSITAE